MTDITAALIKAVNERITICTTDGTIINSTGNTVARMTGVFSDGDKPKIDIHTVRGTLENPEPLKPGNYGMNLSFTTFFEEKGKDIGKSLATLVPQINEDADITHPAPASNLNILVNAGTSDGEYANDYRVWRFNSSGALESKIVQCFEQNTATINSIKPKNGMIIYNSDTHKFQGYANGVWIDLH